VHRVHTCPARLHLVAQVWNEGNQDDADYKQGALWRLGTKAGRDADYNGNAPRQQHRTTEVPVVRRLQGRTYALRAPTTPGSVQRNSQLFARNNAQEVNSLPPFENIVPKAVTPVFSPDGKHVPSIIDGGQRQRLAQAGAGKSLAVMDFSCPGNGRTDGTPTCSSPRSRTCGCSTRATIFWVARVAARWQRHRLHDVTSAPPAARRWALEWRAGSLDVHRRDGRCAHRPPDKLNGDGYLPPATLPCPCIGALGADGFGKLHFHTRGPLDIGVPHVHLHPKWRSSCTSMP